MAHESFEVGDFYASRVDVWLNGLKFTIDLDKGHTSDASPFQLKLVFEAIKEAEDVVEQARIAFLEPPKPGPEKRVVAAVYATTETVEVQS